MKKNSIALAVMAALMDQRGNSFLKKGHIGTYGRGVKPVVEVKPHHLSGISNKFNAQPSPYMREVLRQAQDDRPVVVKKTASVGFSSAVINQALGYMFPVTPAPLALVDQYEQIKMLRCVLVARIGVVAAEVKMEELWQAAYQQRGSNIEFVLRGLSVLVRASVTHPALSGTPPCQEGSHGVLDASGNLPGLSATPPKNRRGVTEKKMN